MGCQNILSLYCGPNVIRKKLELATQLGSYSSTSVVISNAQVSSCGSISTHNVPFSAKISAQ